MVSSLAAVEMVSSLRTERSENSTSRRGNTGTEIASATRARTEAPARSSREITISSNFLLLRLATSN